MFFEEPKWLWLLLAAFIPLFLHLINRGKKSVVDVGSLDWLKQKDQQQTNNIKFQQFWLWLLRTLIFLLIAFTVTKPFFTKNEKIDKRHLLFIKEGTSNEILNNVLDTIETNKWNTKWLNWNLEDVDFTEKNTPKTNAIHPYEAIELLEFENINPLSVTVLGNFNEAELKAKSIPKSLVINWILLPSKKEKLQIELGVKKTQSSSKVLHIQQKEYLSKVTISDIENEELPVIDFSLDTMLIVYDKNEKQLAKVIYSVLKALTTYHQIETNILKQKVSNLEQNHSADVLFWLSDKDLKDNNSFNKIFYYDKSLIKNTSIKSKVKDAMLFNVDENDLKIPSVLNDMLFKNTAIDKKYDELTDLPINTTFYKNWDVEKQTIGSTNIEKKVSLTLVLIPMLFLLILMERGLALRTNFFG